MDKQRCDECEFWSMMLARCIDGGPVEAFCLKKQKYTCTFLFGDCEFFKEGDSYDTP